jgi:gliding motility-associated transport system permease protein
MSKSSRRRARIRARKQSAGQHVRTEAVRVKAAAVPARIASPVQVLPRRSSIGTIGAIARRELLALLRAPLGWGIAAVFLFLASGFGFIGTVIAGQQASFDGIYQVINGLLTLALVPLLTLRLRAQGATRIPARDYELVAGRWLGAFAFYVLLIAVTLVYLVLLTIYVRGQSLDIGLIGATYVGLLAVGAAATAIGVLASASVNNRVVAYVLGLALIGWVWYSTFVAGSFSGTTRIDVLDYVSAFNRYQSFSLGQLALRDAVYFASLTLGALVLAIPLLRSRR